MGREEDKELTWNEVVRDFYLFLVPFSAGTEDAIESTPVGKETSGWHVPECILSCLTCGLCGLHGWILQWIKQGKNMMEDLRIQDERIHLAEAEVERLEGLLKEKMLRERVPALAVE